MAYLPHSEIEIINPHVPRGEIRHALFDFDGTISLIREGWQQVMIPMMVEFLLQTPRREAEEALTAHVTQIVDRTTGQQSIYQMIALHDEVKRRGGTPLEPLAYKRMYLERLLARIEHRIAGLKEGRIVRESLLVPGAERILRLLRERGITCYLASGTDRSYVEDEAGALGVAPYFSGGIYGAVDDYKSYSKAMVIANILQSHGISGGQLVVFGDGYVEIENAKAAGGIAIAVATDEVHPGRIDVRKRARLIEASADVVIPDFHEADLLLAYLCNH